LPTRPLLIALLRTTLLRVCLQRLNAAILHVHEFKSDVLISKSNTLSVRTMSVHIGSSATLLCPQPGVQSRYGLLSSPSLLPRRPVRGSSRGRTLRIPHGPASAVPGRKQHDSSSNGTIVDTRDGTNDAENINSHIPSCPAPEHTQGGWEGFFSKLIIRTLAVLCLIMVGSCKDYHDRSKFRCCSAQKLHAHGTVRYRCCSAPRALTPSYIAVFDCYATLKRLPHACRRL
jgi:hypothetical protein